MDKGIFAHYNTETKMTYVKKIEDEMTKIHKENDNELTSGYMPQVFNPDGSPHQLCPIISYENYINHLNPKIPNLWQQPLKKFPDNPWIQHDVVQCISSGP